MAADETYNIGTCGFGRTRKDKFAEKLNCVEIQHTFYYPPEVETLEKWRAEMPADFRFTVKAWQLITHTAGSPTYRRFKRPFTEQEELEAGAFRPNATVDEAWQTTLAAAKALNARAILFQCPAKFTQTVEHIADMRQFFERVERDGLIFAWEPRGTTWDVETISELCRDLDLRHVVDPFKTRTATPDRIYYRLHGIGGWRYEYEQDELEELAAMMPTDGESFVFFNNRLMFDDAVRFRSILAAGGR